MRARVSKTSRRVVEKIVAEGRIVYGVNTGFGKLSDVHIPLSQLRELQLNLVRSHACGLGAPLSEAEARALVLLRANVLALGYSGCRPIIIETLIAIPNAVSLSGHSRERLGWREWRFGAVSSSRFGVDRRRRGFLSWRTNAPATKLCVTLRLHRCNLKPKKGSRY